MRFCWGISLPCGQDFIPAYSSWLGGTASPLHKDPAQDGCGWPHKSQVINPLLFLLVSLVLLLLCWFCWGSDRGCVHTERETARAYRGWQQEPVLLQSHISSHFFYATAVCVADHRAARGFSSLSEVTVSEGWAVLQQLLKHATSPQTQMLFSRSELAYSVNKDDKTEFIV